MYPLCDALKERVAFGDRAIPIHTRTLGLAYLPERDGRVLLGGETLQYEPICMLLYKLAPP